MATFVKIASVEVGSGGSTTIDFSNIPQNYSDLYAISSCRGTGGTTSNDGHLRINGSTTGYTSVIIYGTGTGSPTAAGGGGDGTFLYWLNEVAANGLTANSFSNNSIYFPNYTSSSQKSISSDSVIENNSTFGVQVWTAGTWNNSAAITSLSFSLDYGSFTQYSKITLYGINKK